VRARAGLLALAGRFGLQAGAWVGFGANPGQALAQALGSASPWDALRAYASPFKADREVDHQLALLQNALAALGVDSLQKFSALPARTLGARFGALAATLQERVAGNFAMAWPRFVPLEKIEESLSCTDPSSDDACLDFTLLEFYLKRLFDRLAARLRGRHLRAAARASATKTRC
jgi:hypothetical protein